VGKDIFSWLYLGDEIRYDWMNEDYHYPGVYVKRSYMASEPILCLSHQLLSYKGFNLKGFVRDEYTYDFKDGAGIRNDVVIGLIMPIGKYVETGISWRHIDRVHYYDSDTFEGTVTLVF